MKPIKIGYLPLYIQLYDDDNPNDRIPMERYMHTLISMLEGQGLEIVCPQICRVQEEAAAAAALFRKEDVAAVITQHLAYSPSLESLSALLSLQVPLIVLDTTPDYELLAHADEADLTMNNHGIHGVQDLCSMLKRNGRPYELFVGHALHSDVIARVAGACRAAAARKAFHAARVGLAGGVFQGMGDFQVSPEALRRATGAEVLSLDAAETQRCLAAVSDGEVEAEILWEKQHFTDEREDRGANYTASVRSGLALRRWVSDHALTACTVNFLGIDRCGLPKMPFTEMSKLLTRGIGYAGEGDVLTAGLVGALRSVYFDTTFTEMFSPDWKENLILLSHMGEVNLNLAQWKPVLRTMRFRFNSCGDTAAAFACMRPGCAVLANLVPSEDKPFTLILTPVTMMGCGHEFGAYRGAVQGWMRPCMPVADFLRAYSLAGGTHHSALVYDVPLEELEIFGRMMGFQTVVLSA